MTAHCVRLSVASLVLLAVLQVDSQAQAAPALDGEISGFEIRAQGDAGGALFLFAFDGKLNGRNRDGVGWIEVFHDPLPIPYQSADIVGGGGVIWIGLQRFEVTIDGRNSFLTTLPDGNNFQLFLSLDIRDWRGRRMDHNFVGLLSHDPLIPIIGGQLAPAAAP